MKPKFSAIIFSVGFLFAVLLSGCNNSNSSLTGASQKTQSLNLAPWEYTATIAEPIQATAGLEPVVMASPQEDVSISIPILAFDSATELILSNPESVPDIDTSKFQPIGAPIDIAGATTRLNRPAVLTFRVDPQSYAEDLRDQSIWITYYDGQTWEYFSPDAVNQETGEINFETFHFSLFGTGKISEEERLDQYAHKQAVLEFAEKSKSQLIEKMAKTASEEVAKQLGLDPNSTTTIVIESMSNTGDYINMADQLHKGDYKEFSKTLSKIVTEKMAKVGIKAVTNLGPQAALVHLIELETKLLDHGINSWSEEEVEAAYQLYKSGKGGRGFFGYFTSTGDFDEIWVQMRGVSHQLESEALEREIARRQYEGLPQPTADELEDVRNQVKADLKKQFDDRLKNEEVIAKQEKRIKSLIEALQKARLLEKYSFGYDPDTYTLEGRLDQLFVLSNKILRDTGRSYLLSGDLSTEKEVSYGDLVALMQAWYISPEEYERELEKRFGEIKPLSTATITPTLETTSTPISLSNCERAFELPIKLYKYTGEQWEEDINKYYINVIFTNGEVIKNSGWYGRIEANGTYGKDGDINFTFSMFAGSRVITGNFSGQFYWPEPDICSVKGTVNGTITDNIYFLEKEFTSFVDEYIQ